MKLPSCIKSIDNELWFTEDDRDNLKVSYRIKEIVFSQMSDIQHIMILDSYDFGRMLVLDGAVQTTSLDGYIYNEMITHVALTLHKKPQKVLIIGGGDCGAAREATKYPEVKQIDMVEIDEMVVKVSKEYLQDVSGNLSDPRVNFIFTDGVKYAAECKEKYDVIIVDSSDPVGPAEQLIELSFYKNLYNLITDDGIMVCQSQSPIFNVDIMSKMYQRISSHFSCVRLYTATVPTYPGGFWSFTLGAKRNVELQNIKFDKETKYINEELIKSCFDLPEFINKTLKIGN